MLNHQPIYDDNGLYILNEKRYLQRVLKTYIKPDMTFVDVGANDGRYTRLAAHLMKGKGRIVSYEPQPIMSGLIKDMCETSPIYSIVETVPKGAWSEDATQTLRIPEDNKASSFFDIPDELKIVNQIEANVERIDSRVKRFDMAIVDTAGSEVFVLDGMSDLLWGLDKFITFLSVYDRGPGKLKNIRDYVEREYGLTTFSLDKVAKKVKGDIVLFKDYKRPDFEKSNLMEIP